MKFIEKNGSVEKAIAILSKSGIQINEDEAKIILGIVIFSIKKLR